MAPLRRFLLPILTLVSGLNSFGQADPAPTRETVLQFAPNPHQANGREESVTVGLRDTIGGLRHYLLTTTQPQRDDQTGCDT